MGRKKTHAYAPTPFGTNISILQKQHGYTDEYVIDHVVDEFNIPLINDVQTYGAYKSGKRKTPHNFADLLIAFSKFYNVTTDYLLGIDLTPNHQVKAIQDVTGLSEIASRNLIYFHNNYKNIMQMIDVIISYSTKEDICFFINLYNQIYSDYKIQKKPQSDTSFDINRQSQQINYTEHLYSYLKQIVIDHLSSEFDKQILTDSNMNTYFHSPEYMHKVADFADECRNYDHNLEYPDGKIEHLRSDRY